MNERDTPLIIAVAPNGAYKSKHDHPNIPLNPLALASTARDCVEAGASMIHLHVRDKEGRHSLDPDLYRTAIDAVETAVGDRLSIQVTSEAAGRYTAAEQIAAMRALKPRSLSLALREIIPSKEAVGEAAGFLLWLSREAILPQYILYNDEDVQRYNALCASGIIPDTPHWVLFVLGRYAKDQQSSPEQLDPFLRVFDGSEIPWAVCAFGKTEFDCVAYAARQGGHARIGFENNLYLKDGELAQDNVHLIDQFARHAKNTDYKIADADNFRARFNGWG